MTCNMYRAKKNAWIEKKEYDRLKSENQRLKSEMQLLRDEAVRKNLHTAVARRLVSF